MRAKNIIMSLAAAMAVIGAGRAVRAAGADALNVERANAQEAGKAKVPNEEKQWAWLGFERPEGVNPIFSPDASITFQCPMRHKKVAWEAGATFNPAATVYKGKVVVLFRAEDALSEGIGSRTSRLGYASSADGVHFTKEKKPVFYPDPADGQIANENPGGCEDPRVAQTEDGLYVLLYTQWNRKRAQLAVATSRNLKKWKKYGPVFAKAKVKGIGMRYTKSASLVTKLKDGKLVIARINGKYWMYWGEDFVNLASSDDLIHWQPVTDANGNVLKIMTPRKGYFDSMLTECGPPAIVTDKGILLFYNGKNSPSSGDKRYGGGAYCAGQALFSLDDMTRLVDRLDNPFFYPEADFEKSGQYKAGTVFIEGLVPFKNKWYLYYGCADSHVGVAVKAGK